MGHYSAVRMRAIVYVHSLYDPMLPHLTQHDVGRALDEVVAELLAACDVHLPPVDAIALAGRLAMTVAFDDQQQGRARMVRLRRGHGPGGTGTIFLKPDPRPERQQWAVAHEIGEQFAHRVFALLGVSPAEAAADARERVANALAGRLLLPSRCFSADALELQWDLPVLKQQYATASHELIARRMLDFDPAIIITVFDNGRITSRTTNIRHRPAPLSNLEQGCQRQAHETVRPQCSEDLSQRIQAWPIHEPDWKREILRSELLEQLD
jgi:hypothetical protein